MNDVSRTRTASDVAQLETDLAYFRDQCEKLSRDLAIMTGERNRLQVENTLLQASSAENHRKSSRVEGILDNLCHGLVHSLKEIREERAVALEMRRQVREEVAPVERRDPPQPRIAHEPPPVRDHIEEVPRDLDEEARARAEQLRGAAEHVATRVPLPHPQPTYRPRMDHTLADNDSRLPRLTDVGTGASVTRAAIDDVNPNGELAALASLIGGKTAAPTRR